MNAVVNIVGLILIGFIIWWFWLSHSKARRVTGAGPIEVVVDNGVYTPARIAVPAGQPVTLRFVRRDPSPCAEQVVFDDLNVSAELPVGKPYELTLTPPKGEHAFTCQMRMYQGVLVAE